MVCLPFCHRAGPLINSKEQGRLLLERVRDEARRLNARLVEARDWPNGVEVPSEIRLGNFYCRHVIDLTGGPESVMSALDKDMRYSIRRAQRNGVTVRTAQGPADMALFFRLYLGQRRRQGLLPQPQAFLRAIYERLVEPGNGFVVIAEHEGRAVCALLSVSHGNTVIGTHSAACSAARGLRAMPLAMWKSIEIACRRGQTTYDLGRSDTESAGLQRFKEDWGGRREELPYYYYPKPGGVNAGQPHGLAKSLLQLYGRYAPDPLFAALGSALYGHLG